MASSEPGWTALVAADGSVVDERLVPTYHKLVDIRLKYAPALCVACLCLSCPCCCVNFSELQ